MQIRLDTGEIVIVREYSNSGKDKLLAIHGMGTYAGWFNEFHELSKDHFDLISFDLIGFGESGKRGEISSYKSWIQSVEMIWEHITENNKNNQVFLLGHSFGAILAILALKNLKRKPNKVILTSPGFGINLKTWDLLRFVLPTLFKGLINHSEEVSLPVAEEVSFAVKTGMHKIDSLTGKVKPQLLLEMLKASLIGLISYQNLKDISTLMILAGDDIFCENNLSKLFFDLIPQNDKFLQIVENAPHDLFVTSCQELNGLISDFIVQIN